MSRFISSHTKSIQYNLILEISVQGLCLDLNYLCHDYNSDLYHIHHTSLNVGSYTSYFSITSFSIDTNPTLIY